jgi:hypothetical protein
MNHKAYNKPGGKMKNKVDAIRAFEEKKELANTLFQLLHSKDAKFEITDTEPLLPGFIGIKIGFTCTNGGHYFTRTFSKQSFQNAFIKAIDSEIKNLLKKIYENLADDLEKSQPELISEMFNLLSFTKLEEIK